MNVAVIVAAGSGSRFGGDTPKIFLDLKGIPVIVRTLRKFEDCEMIDSIILVIAESYMETMKQLVSDYKIGKVTAFAAGAESRSGSVRNGIALVEASETRLVVIHDGARPLVKVEDIESTIRAAAATGAAVLTVPVTDTVKEVRTGKVVRTIDRESLRRAVTPQVFNHQILLVAVASLPDDEGMTDESLLLEMSGFDVAVVEGDVSNIKITHPADMAVAEALIEREIAK
jgi:2-C-methyl-D-erythritol 4-phosphate cytidylyltransferase